MPAVWISMALFALAGAISPGPVNVIASSQGARHGFWRALPHVAGASLSYCAVVLLMGGGMQWLLQTWPALTTVTQYAGALYLLYLAFKIARAPVQALNTSAPPTQHTHWAHNALHGALTQGLNPKAWLVALSGVSLFVPTGADAGLRLWSFCAISGFVCFGSVACWAALGTLIRQWLQPASHQRLFNRVMAGLLVLTVLDMVDLL
ncbi:LysE family translocator [Rhodoferax saidenbachensis]|uniref:Threonine/homoserine/homoserine lactone efflux protein n=1 Tax=Rhodoferax saidenbachensis TaxID=1484693 RepID=A0ABU1ZGU4_9BURK|nr:LysE family translocator [Rhodoferax saidenbachensis]MDR7304754.1 threonine/homoserine/homoserine lactone efflux protein [Rhodoferax saidenbachensis]